MCVLKSGGSAQKGMLQPIKGRSGDSGGGVVPDKLNYQAPAGVLGGPAGSPPPLSPDRRVRPATRVKRLRRSDTHTAYWYGGLSSSQIYHLVRPSGARSSGSCPTKGSIGIWLTSRHYDEQRHVARPHIRISCAKCD